MGTISIEQLELEYYKSCAKKIRKVIMVLNNEKLSDKEKVKEIKKIVGGSHREALDE